MGPGKRVIECREGFLEEAIWSGRNVQDEDEVTKLRRTGGLSWQSRGWDYVLPMQGACVGSLLGELTSPMLPGVIKIRN